MTNAGKSHCGFSSAKVTNAANDSQRSRTAPLPCGRSAAQPAALRIPRTSSPSTPVAPPARAAPLIRVTPSRTSGRSKNRSAPRMTTAIPRADNADSRSADCAFIRNNTAISRAEIPLRRCVEIDSATAVASATSSECDCTVGSTPGSRIDRKVTAARECACTITALALLTISGVHR
ncbi:unannotated protein [freshwater metagenome]|uniref:Unannotated protein n=1 Tax=freshwater metagenome TaxID=449393 RepID=A0A6J7DYR4_9ZZZZ